MTKLIFVMLIAMTALASVGGAQTTSKPKPAGKLKNDPVREEAFMDWGLGMFVHWSFDSQLGSVISHSMDYASRDYLDRYVNDDGLEVSVKRAQRLYNNRRWPNAVVFRLENVKFEIE